MIRKNSQAALWVLPLLFIAVLTCVCLSTGDAKRECPGGNNCCGNTDCSCPDGACSYLPDFDNSDAPSLSPFVHPQFV